MCDKLYLFFFFVSFFCPISWGRSSYNTVIIRTNSLPTYINEKTETDSHGTR